MIFEFKFVFSMGPTILSPKAWKKAGRNGVAAGGGSGEGGGRVGRGGKTLREVNPYNKKNRYAKK